eukprot:751683-Hanusia_phi.AAC.1
MIPEPTLTGSSQGLGANRSVKRRRNAAWEERREGNGEIRINEAANIRPTKEINEENAGVRTSDEVQRLQIHSAGRRGVKLGGKSCREDTGVLGYQCKKCGAPSRMGETTETWKRQTMQPLMELE